MNILTIHNTYQQRGGEDSVVEAETALLRDAGHQVRLLQVSNDSISGFAAKARAFLNTPYDPSRKVWLTEYVTENRPDVVHIHNFFPLLTPAIHEAAAELGLPVVQTLHNYRLLCANANFLLNGTVCEKCTTHGRYWGAIHRCYRGSLPASIGVVRMQNRAFRNRTWHKYVQRFIVLTKFAKGKFVAGGLPAERLAIKPNFVARDQPPRLLRKGALFVGRLSPEKGADTLIRAWHKLRNIPLTIVGGGPEQKKLMGMAPANVHFAGQQPREEVVRQMVTAQVLIIPSICFEGFPMTVVEAFAAGLPVIASNIGSLSEIVVPRENGVHFKAGDAEDLADKVREQFDTPTILADLGAGARATYEKHYTPEANLECLERIYAEAIATFS